MMFVVKCRPGFWLFSILFISGLTSVGKSQESSAFFAAPKESVSNFVMPGAFFRIKLMMTDVYLAKFGDKKQQLYVATEVDKRLSLDNDDVKEVMKDFRPDLSEKEAAALLARVRKVNDRNVAKLEDDLRDFLDANVYEEVVLLQLGLLGLTGFVDDKICEVMKIDEATKGQVRKLIEEIKDKPYTKIQQVELSKKDKLEAEKDVYKVMSLLNTEQKDLFKRAGALASAFRKRENSDQGGDGIRKQ